jgi:hypothetical protein
VPPTPSRTLIVALLLGLALVGTLALAMGGAATVLHDALAWLAPAAKRAAANPQPGAPAHAAVQASPPRAVLGKAQSTIPDPSAELDTDPAATGEAALQTATEADPDIGALVDDPDRNVRAAARAFFEDPHHPAP